MAYYATLVSVLQSLKEIIDHNQYSKFLLDKQQIASVYEKLSHLETLLEDYSPKDEEAADCLERRIRDAAYRVQDILESQHIIEYKSLNLISSEEKFHRINTVLPHLFLSKLKRAMPRQRQDMEKVKEEVDSIVEEVTRVKIKKSHTTEELELTNYHSASQQKQTSCGDNMVGFEEQRATIIDQLFGESSKLEVVPLVGMGGIGKTTMARSIFYDKFIASHFDHCAWVTVSQNYQPRKLLLDILNSMNLDPKNLSGVHVRLLKECIYKHLKWRRYLIILDDIWDTNVWDDMKMIFPDDSYGSRIILTTRLSNVAVYANRYGNLHQMQFLNEDQSWNLLREKVFAQENCPRELEVIGRLIAKNCRGLPLAIVVVAGLLSKVNKARNDWEEIARNVISATTENDEYLSKILSLSYNQLPHHLKPCFLYMGGFPRDCEISISMLIKLWVAEGFLKPDESKSVEDKGKEYLEDLVKRNLVLITKKKSNGKLKSCSIHDVLRDLCMKRARYESFFHFVENDDNFYTQGTRNNVRRLCIHPGHSQFVKAQEFGSYVGSILCFSDISKLLTCVPEFKILRTLDARKVRFCSFPVEVLELSRLRYLALRRGQCECKFKIPPRISELANLQTLMVVSSKKLHLRENLQALMAGPSKKSCLRTFPAALPIEIWELPHLRHVILGMVELSSCIPFACISENLQTLSKVLDFKWANEVIQMIPNLKKLGVIYTTKKLDGLWEKYCLYNLIRLCQLETLDIQLHADEAEILPFPANFAFPQKLKKLSLSDCQIPWENMTVIGSLPNLQVLKLVGNAFVGEEWVSKEGEFLQLKILLMYRVTLTYWRAEKTHFPRLEQIKIFASSLGVGIPLEIGDIPTLELIEVQKSDNATYKSVFQIEDEQQNSGNYMFQLHADRRQWKSFEANWMKSYH